MHDEIYMKDNLKFVKLRVFEVVEVNIWEVHGENEYVKN